MVKATIREYNEWLQEMQDAQLSVSERYEKKRKWLQATFDAMDMQVLVDFHYKRLPAELAKIKESNAQFDG